MITKLLNEVNEKIETLNNLVQDKEYFEKLEERIEKVNNYVQKQKEEIERLNNVINEFDKWIDEESEKTILSTGHLTCLMMCKNKLQELKGSNNNE